MSVNPCKDCITFAICRSCVYPWLNKANHILLLNYHQLIEPKCTQLADYIRTHHKTEKHKKTKQYTSDVSFIIQYRSIKCNIIRKTFA